MISPKLNIRMRNPGSNAESRSLTLGQRHNFAVEVVQAHGLQRSDLRRRVDNQHAAIGERGSIVFAVRKAAGSGGDGWGWRHWRDVAADAAAVVGVCDDLIQLDTARAGLIRVNQVERHGVLTIWPGGKYLPFSSCPSIEQPRAVTRHNSMPRKLTRDSRWKTRKGVSWSSGW